MSEEAAAVTGSGPIWRRSLRWVALTVVLLASVFFLHAVVDQLAAFRRLDWNLVSLLALLFTAFIMLLVVVLGGLMWWVLLRDQGAPASVGTAIEIVSLAQLAKYLPGNVGHVLGQVSLAAAAGIPVATAIATVLISTLWLLAVGLGVAGLALLVLVEVPQLSHVGPGGLLLAGLGLAGSPWLGIGILNRYLPSVASRLGRGRPLRQPGWFAGLALGSGFLFCFLLFGVMLLIQARYVFAVEHADLFTLTVLFTAAWVVGYVVPGAPGGLGVREALMVLLFTPVVGAAAAVGLGVTMRLATTAGDGLAFLLGTGLRGLRGVRRVSA